ncbi:MAG: 16S rRNA processing protein RimM [Clostridia bacterium]|nr:16S rRNA processing protein RimM [Clostridia bacterium]
MLKQFIETGKIVGTHGVRGELRVQPWADTPDFLLQFRTLYLDVSGQKPLQISNARTHGNLVLMKIKGIDSIDAAEALRNKIIYMNRTDVCMDKELYFIQDLIGCQVYDHESGEPLGTLTDVSQTGANDVWHIRQNGKEFLIPAIAEVVHTVDPASNKVTITPLKGIFDDAD